ncbi:MULTISPECIES: DUF3533 domain-containing protein [unclassified Streptomyces]|uniref:DUF3533 domain-containing protein n=1 Tax=unclassified Streptomyces TaxID=2593676 RepID=UPI003805F721
MSAPAESSLQETEEPLPAKQGFLSELQDAVQLRTVLLLVGVLVLQFGFILSYIGAFHSPKPHKIPIAVVAPAQVSAQTVSGLNTIASTPVEAKPVASRAAAEKLIRSGETSAALIVDAKSTKDTLLVASGGGVSEVTAITEVVTEADAAQDRTVTVQDIVPLQSGDGRGLSGFYLVIGWIVGGYLVAALLGVAAGARPVTTRRAIFRVGALVPYAILSGLGGAIIADPVLGALTGHFMALWGIGALLVVSAATVTMAFQSLFGVIGIGITVLVFVVLGNPSAGGAYQPSLLPAFWRTISGALPNGAGTEAVRHIVYFGGHGIGGHLAVIIAYVVAGTLVAVLVPAVRARRTAPEAG